MILKKLSLLNFKNVKEATLLLSPKINCFIGQNGVGKTNVLDAIYVLSFCHSAYTSQDSLVIRHGESFFVIEGDYEEFSIYCGMKRGTKKHFKRDNKEYKRLSEHIGLIPIVMVAPGDTMIIDLPDERRRFMDMVISQLNRSYMESLNRYNKALQQRNVLLKKDEEELDWDVIAILEEQMALEGEFIYEQRDRLVSSLVPRFQEFYSIISGGREQVSLRYISHCQRGPLLDVIRQSRMKDHIMGYSLHGVHRDDWEILLDDHAMRHEGSQGQQKTFVIALKLAQYDILRQARPQTKPILLLDDIFDKLDANRVEKIINLVSGEGFGQIFVTDTNRDHLDQILQTDHIDYRLFLVEHGEIKIQS